MSPLFLTLRAQFIAGSFSLTPSQPAFLLVSGIPEEALDSSPLGERKLLQTSVSLPPVSYP